MNNKTVKLRISVDEERTMKATNKFITEVQVYRFQWKGSRWAKYKPYGNLAIMQWMREMENKHLGK